MSEVFRTLKESLALAPATKVIVVTGHDDWRNAVTAIGLGASDFYEKPIDPEMLAFVVERAARVRFLEDENRRLAVAGFSPPIASLTDLPAVNIAMFPKLRRKCLM